MNKDEVNNNMKMMEYFGFMSDSPINSIFKIFRPVNYVSTKNRAGCQQENRLFTGNQVHF